MQITPNSSPFSREGHGLQTGAAKRLRLPIPPPAIVLQKCFAAKRELFVRFLRSLSFLHPFPQPYFLSWSLALLVASAAAAAVAAAAAAPADAAPVVAIFFCYSNRGDGHAMVPQGLHLREGHAGCNGNALQIARMYPSHPLYCIRPHLLFA